MGTGHLGDGDVDGVLQVLDEARHDGSGEPMPWALLEGLLRLVPCDWGVSYQDLDHAGRRCELIQEVRPGLGRAVGRPADDAVDHPFWRLWWSSVCSWPQRTGDLRTVVRASDVLFTDRVQRADPMSREALPEVGDCMIVSLPAPAGHARRVLFQHGDRHRFTDRDRELATLLRPHVQEIWLDTLRRRARVPRLSPREWEVLALSAGGLSTAEIAGALFLSPGTVRKHAEHIRERLGVHSMAAAAAVAMPHAPAAHRGRGPQRIREWASPPR
jgi:DNA-binding CsgD family transcriptional regulator